MAFIETINPTNADGEVKDMYLRQQGHYGYVPNYAKAFSHRPQVLARWANLLAEIRRPMHDRLFELATFAAAIELKNSACSLAHGKELAKFITAEAVQAIARGDVVKEISKAENEVILFARKLARDQTSITPQDVESLKANGYSDADIFDIATTVAGRSFLTKILDALGVEVDISANNLDSPFREALTVGKPVGTDAAEVVAHE